MNAIYGYMNSIDKEAAAIDAEVAFIEAKCAAESAVTDIAHEVRLKEIEYKAITEGYDMDTLIDIYEKERAMYFGEAEGGEKESFFQGILDWLRGIINAIFNIKEGANDDAEKLKNSGVSKIALDYGSNLPSVIDGLNGPINNLKNAVATQKTKKIDLKKIGLGALGTIGAVLAWKTFKDKFFGKSTELVPIEQAEKIREDSRKALKKVGKELQALEGVVQNTKPEDVLEENKAAMKQIQAATLRIGGIVKGIEGVVQKDFTIPGGALGRKLDDKMMDYSSDEKKSEGDNQSEPKKKSGNALQNKLDAKGDEKANENYKNAAEKGGKKDGRSLQDRLEAKADKKMYNDAKNVPKYEEYWVNIYRVNCIRKNKTVCYPFEQLTYLISWFFKARKLIKQKHYDLCHCHFLLPTWILSLLLKKLYWLKYIISAHWSDVPWHNPDLLLSINLHQELLEK